jgi:hypothetical protein
MVTPIKIEISFADLLDVINSHNNPAVAMSILDGSYVNPLGNEDRFPRYHKNCFIKNDDDTRDHYQLLFKSYDKWSDKVTFIKDNPAASWSRTDTMSLQDWRDTRDFNPYPLDWSESTPGLV